MLKSLIVVVFGVPLGYTHGGGSRRLIGGVLVFSTAKKNLLIVLAVTAFLAQTQPLEAVPAAAASTRGDAEHDATWCGTHHAYQWRTQEARLGTDRGGCPLDGACDDPLLRDASIPNALTEMKIVQVSIHVFCEDDGSNCAVTQAQIDEDIAALNANLLSWRFQFLHETRFLNDTEFRFFDWPDEEDAMKSAYAVSPTSQLNMYVVTNSSLFSYAIFPWQAEALTYLGGIVLDHRGFAQPGKITTHEVGHALGLWHTHHGPAEYPLEYFDDPCLWACYEWADGTDADTTGDKCSDTPSTPGDQGCGSPEGTDDCNSTAWGTTDFENYMSWALLHCTENHFTAQQVGRLHCWTEDVLDGWFTEVPQIPTASAWGVVVMTLGLLSVGTLILRRGHSTS